MLSPNVGKKYALEIPVIQRKWTGITFGSLHYPNPLGQVHKAFNIVTLICWKNN